MNPILWPYAAAQAPQQSLLGNQPPPMSQANLGLLSPVKQARKGTLTPEDGFTPGLFSLLNVPRLAKGMFNMINPMADQQERAANTQALLKGLVQPFMLPGQVMRGEGPTDQGELVERAFDTATMAVTGGALAAPRAAQAAAAQLPDIPVVAMRLKDGRTVRGNPGEVHADLYQRYGEKPTERSGNVGFAYGDEYVGRAEAYRRLNPEVRGLLQNKAQKLEANDLATATGNYVRSPGLLNAPQNVMPNEALRQLALDYTRQAGLPYRPPRAYVPVDEARAAKVADEFAKMEHNPNDYNVRKSYNALTKETKAQYDALKKSGLKIEFIKPGQKDPYAASPRMAIDDMRDNNHLWVYPTDEGFGTSPKFNKDHPMLEDSGVEIDGRKLKNNDLFRIVHDVFGHGKEGVGFRAAGEDNAFRQHRAMFSDEAVPALATETRGQNSWVNFGPKGEANRAANAADTVFADQKVGLLPEWARLYANARTAAPSGLLPAYEAAAKLPKKADVDPHQFGMTAWADRPLDQIPIERTLDPSMPMAPENIFSPEQFYRQHKGSVVMPSPWDLSLGGHRITSIDGMPVDIAARGGQKFMRTHAKHGIAGASEPTVVSKMSNQIEKLQKQHDTDQIIMTPATMGSRGIDFSNHASDAILAMLPHSKISKEGAKAVKERMAGGIKESVAGGGSKLYKYPDFPGINSPKLAEWLSKSGNRRKHFVKLMDNRAMIDAGVPAPGLARYAMTDPELVGAPMMASGRHMALVKPGAAQNYPDMHPSYSTGILGDYIGGFDRLYDINQMYPDWMSRVGQHKKNPRRSFELGGADRAQLITQQWLDQLMGSK